MSGWLHGACECCKGCCPPCPIITDPDVPCCYSENSKLNVSLIYEGYTETTDCGDDHGTNVCTFVGRTLQNTYSLFACGAEVIWVQDSPPVVCLPAQIHRVCGGGWFLFPDTTIWTLQFICGNACQCDIPGQPCVTCSIPDFFCDLFTSACCGDVVPFGDNELCHYGGPGGGPHCNIPGEGFVVDKFDCDGFHFRTDILYRQIFRVTTVECCLDNEPGGPPGPDRCLIRTNRMTIDVFDNECIWDSNLEQCVTI